MGPSVCWLKLPFRHRPPHLSGFAAGDRRLVRRLDLDQWGGRWQPSELPASKRRAFHPPVRTARPSPGPRVESQRAPDPRAPALSCRPSSENPPSAISESAIGRGRCRCLRTNRHDALAACSGAETESEPAALRCQTLRRTLLGSSRSPTQTIRTLCCPFHWGQF